MISVKKDCAEITLPSSCWERSFKFANEVIDTNIDKYQKRGQGARDKIIDQIAQGKLAEIAVSKFFSSIGLTVTLPDFKIYSKWEKSYDADLDIQMGKIFYPIHVKSISTDSASHFGLSWIFQRSDPLYFASARIDLKYDKIALCETLSRSVVRFYGLCNPTTLRSNSKPLRVESLRDNKVALYHKGISEQLSLLPQIDAITTFHSHE